MRSIIFVNLLILLLAGTGDVMGQVISGRVTSEPDGEALPGVTVQIKGTSQGSITDLDGNYQIEVGSADNTLVFSYVGMRTKEVVIGGQSQIDVTLEQDITELSEVIVTAVGIKRQKESIGYAVQDVDGEDLAAARQSNVINALNGKVAGVQITSSSGSPGAASSITIRGVKSLLRSSAPLFIVDGVPIDNSGGSTSLGGYEGSNRVIDINPDDIASITVLKGAPATALYGIRASGGAIVITTKKGEFDSKATITFNTSIAFDRVSQLPELQQRFSQGTGGNYSQTSSRSWGALMDTLRYDGIPTARSRFGSIVGMSDPNATGRVVEPFDNTKGFFETGITYINTLSFSAGNEKSSFYASLGHHEQQGIVPNAEFARTSFKITAETAITKKLSVTGSASYSNSTAYRLRKGSTTAGVMIGLLRATPSFDLTNGVKNPLNDPSAYLIGETSQRNFTDVYDNPYYSVNHNFREEDIHRILSYALFNYEITDWLSLSYRVGADVYADRRKEVTGFFSSAQTEGDLSNSHFLSRQFNSDLIIKFNKEINDDISLGFSAGLNNFSDLSESVSVFGSGFVIPGFEHISNVPNTPDRGNSLTRKKLAAVYFDGLISWKQMVFLNFTGRNEYTSTLTKGNNSFFYPSANTGFVFTKLPGLDRSNVMSYGKIRASIAFVGNDAPVFVTDSYFNDKAVGDFATGSTQVPPFNGQLAFLPDGTIADPNLQPESNRTYEIGAELGFFTNRIRLDGTYYNSLSTDQIIQRDISPSSGFTSATVNSGEISNQGVEMILNVAVVDNQSLTWDISVNFSKNKNEVLSIGATDEEQNNNPDVPNGLRISGLGSAQTWAIVGKPYGQILGASFAKDPTTGKDLVDENGYPILNPTPTIIGDPNPDWLAGITNTISYKGITLSALIDIRQGGQVWNGTRAVLHTLGMAKATETRDENTIIWDGVTESGQQNTVAIAEDETLNSLGTGIVATAGRFVEDGSWIRLRDLNLSYNIPSDFLDDSLFKSIRLNVGARNLVVINDYKGIDPETNLQGASLTSGLDYFNMPNTKTYRASVTITF